MILTVSSKGQISIPASLRHKLGLVTGSKLNLSISGRLLQLEPVYVIQPATLESALGVVTASATGKARNLADFDVASMATL
ncbi:MAG TPA: AbrB/MazE/SpoVT family DNA-binding domain-containing protein [Aquirhabdus sp.]